MSLGGSYARRVGFVIAIAAALTLLASVGFAAAGRRAERPASHESQWIHLHGRDAVRNLASCRRCHTAYECRACHLAEWPHPARWGEVHGKQASSTGSRGCTLCHSPGFCDPCHGGLKMPHSDDFIEQHTSTHDRATCLRCHAATDCERCHDEHARHNAGGLVLP